VSFRRKAPLLSMVVDSGIACRVASDAEGYLFDFLRAAGAARKFSRAVVKFVMQR
jgi:hypothetical protein